MASKQANIVRVLTYLADDLDARQYVLVGVLRQVTREVALLDDSSACEGSCRCGAPIVQPRTGRPRKFCTTCSPPRKTLRKGDAAEDGQAERRSAA